MPPTKEQRERLGDWFKLGKKLRDTGPDVVKRLLDPLFALKGYCNGTLEAHLHIGVRTGHVTTDTNQFCVRLKAGDDRGCIGEHASRIYAGRGEVPGISHYHVKLFEVLGENRFELSVLVPAHEDIEQSEGMDSSFVFPSVRLVAVDDCSVRLSDAGHSSVDLSREILAVAA